MIVTLLASLSAAQTPQVWRCEDDGTLRATGGGLALAPAEAWIPHDRFRITPDEGSRERAVTVDELPDVIPEEGVGVLLGLSAAEVPCADPPATGQPVGLFRVTPREPGPFGPPAPRLDRWAEGLGIRHRVAPAFPERAVAEHGPTSCRVRARVDALGMPWEITVLGCPEAFHAATEAAVRQWRWDVSERGGLVEVRITYDQR